MSQVRVNKNKLKRIFILGKWLKFRCQHNNTLNKKMSIQPKSTLADLKIKMMTVNLYLKATATLINLASLVHLSFQMITPIITTTLVIILNKEATSATRTKSNQSSKRCL